MPKQPATPMFLGLSTDATTAGRVWQYKHRVKQRVGDQQYLDHPPHLTLYLACFPDREQVLVAAGELARSWRAPALSISGWHSFLGDALTGGNTLVMEFDPASRARLQAMQHDVVSRVAGLRDSDATLERLQGRLAQLTSPEQQAARDCGFPYVGDNWHPHLTIASIAPHDWASVMDELGNEPVAGPISCSHLEVYELIDGQPSLLRSFQLPAHASISPHSGGGPSHSDGETWALRRDIIAALWNVVDRHPWLLSATLTGSFLTTNTLDAVSDIDLIVIVDHLNGPRFDALQREFRLALEPVLAREQLKLVINPTLGPRKLNDEVTAVLHLMLYSREAHHQHVIKSPFTCLDWQRSTTFRRQSMAAVYPVFGLQPHHFMSARRGLHDYLRDFNQGVVSYREIKCTADRCEEIPRAEAMTVRDRYEYAYHVMRFLMQNLLKLVQRRNLAPDGEALVQEFTQVFPRAADEYRTLYLVLRDRKKRRDFSQPIERLDERLKAFVQDFESQFRQVFLETATRHVVFRHARTRLNAGPLNEGRFLGQRTDPSIMPVTDERLALLIEAVTDLPISAAFSSPLARCRQSLAQLARHLPLPQTAEDSRLLEIDYGDCDGQSVAATRRQHPELFEAWQRGEDRPFPGGENTADVAARLQAFAADAWRNATGHTLTCTHNVVLRALVGEHLGVPQNQWHRIQVPHLAPVTIVQTKDFGSFVDLSEDVERQLFAEFLCDVPTFQVQEAA